MITKYFEDKLVGTHKTEPEALNFGNSYRMWNDGSPEIEVLEFLYAMVRILKPKAVLETGTYKGWSAAYMAQGLQDNGSGDITTIEYNSILIKEAEELWGKLGVLSWIESIQGLSYNFKTNNIYDLIFLDTEPDVRFKEMELFYPNLKEGGYLFIHDLSRDMSQNTHNPDHPQVDPWPFGPFPQSMKDKIKTGELVKFHFPTPRGLVGFYKRHEGDYKI